MKDKDIYFRIYSWITNEVLVWQWDDLILELEKDRYVSIFRRSDWDIEVTHYEDKDCEREVDWWWVCVMDDENTTEDMSVKIEEIDIESMQKYLRDKANFLYLLIFMW